MRRSSSSTLYGDAITNSHDITVDVHPRTTLLDIKKQINHEWGCLASRQRLLLDGHELKDETGRELEDDAMLSLSNIKQEDVLHLELEFP